jgi:hypothetical protein
VALGERLQEPAVAPLVFERAFEQSADRPLRGLTSTASSKPSSADSTIATIRSLFDGKCRYSVAIPTPARRAISSTPTSSPSSRQAAVATSIRRARLRGRRCAERSRE